jgi:DNA-binding transcriptional LysR family regulator
VLTQIDLNRLRVFYYVYLTKSITEAAKILNITRSAVSQQIKKFEQEIRMELFIRLHKSLVPTSAGQQLFQASEAFLKQLDTGIKKVQQGGKEPSGLLRIGAPTEYGQVILPKIISKFRKAYRKVTFSLFFGGPDKLIHMVRAGDLDFALIDLFLTHGQFLEDVALYDIVSLIDEEVVLVCSKDYAEIQLQSGFALEALLQADYISYQQNPLAIKTWFKHHYPKVNFAPAIILTMDSVRAVVTAVESHAGLGVVPSHVIDKQLCKGTIVSIPYQDKEIINTISLLQLQDKIPSNADKKFQSFLIEEAKKID